MYILRVALLALTMAFSVAPLFARWGKWLWLSVAAFALAEAGLIAWVSWELSQPDTDGPAVMLVGLVFVVPGVVFCLCPGGRLTWRIVSHLAKSMRKPPRGPA